MSSPPSTGPTPGPFSTLDVRRVAAGGVGPSIMGFLGGGGMDSSSELFLECSVTSVISLFGLVTLLIFFAKHDGGDPFRREMGESTTMSPPEERRVPQQSGTNFWRNSSPTAEKETSSQKKKR